MPRIRTIKPEFWQDEKLAPLPPIDRLVFLGLVSQADDAGRLVDSVRMIDGTLFPFSEDSSRDSLDTLARLGRITRYTSESGQELIQITNWDKHQRVDKPSKYTLPPPPGEVVAGTEDSEPSGDSRETLATSSQNPIAPTYDLRPTTYDQRTTHTPRARSEKQSGGSDPDPTSRDGDLAGYLGEFSGVIEAWENSAKLPKRWRGSVWRQYGPPGMDPTAWKLSDGSSVPPTDRPKFLALTIERMAGEGQGMQFNFMRKVLRRVIAEQSGEVEPARRNGKASAREDTSWAKDLRLGS
ncbi:MAG: hypothetical protein EA351_00335 [Gemmatimonadales bacterium]|nr:MAG: hypothetical protein EA351_00335 [Gemmatimonadales bacterium]